VDREFFARGLDYYLNDVPATGAFIQGCCGDVRPALIKDGEFFRGSLDLESEELARRFAEELKSAKNGNGTTLHFSDRDFFSCSVAELPYNREFPHQNRSAFVTREDAIGEWARCFLDDPIPPAMPLNLSLFNLSHEIAFLFMAGEIVSEYSLFCRDLSGGRVWVGSCAGGITTYIPTAAQLEEGGYESYEAMFYFMQPAPFAEAAEAILKGKVHDLVKGLF
jgi:hypothetical protein